MKEIVFKEFARRGNNAGRPKKWYSNLTSVGNIGSAAIFLKVAEAFTAPLEADGWRIRWIDAQPRVAFPFPWSIWQFFGVFRGNGQRLGLRMHVRAKCERDVGMA
jgi:hypothetical protein